MISRASRNAVRGLMGGAVLLIALAALARFMVPIVDAAVFSHQIDRFEEALWISLGIIAPLLWGLIRAGAAITLRTRWIVIPDSLQRYSSFLAIFYLIFGIHVWLLVELGAFGSSSIDKLLVPFLQILLLAALGGALSPFVFDYRPRNNAIRVFVVLFIGASALYVVRNPEYLILVAVRLGLMTVQQHLLLAVSIEAWFVFLIPVMVLIWVSVNERTSENE